MGVPLIDLTRADPEHKTELEAAVLAVLRSGRYILGPEVEGLEQDLASYLGARHVVGMSSGTDALLAALMALDIGPGDAVAVPVYSFFATAGVVVRLGANPVFVDIEPVHCNLDPDALERALDRNPDIKAVIAVHLYGAAADMDRIVPMLKGRDIPLVEDAAQAIGTRRGGSIAGTWGICGCFSTFPTKNLGGIGDGGFVCTDDDDFVAKLRLMRNHGQADAYRHHTVGGNFRLDAIQAAALRVQMRRIEGITEARRANAARYAALFAARGLTDWVRVPEDVPDRHAYHQYVLHMPATDRERAMQVFKERGVGCGVYYPLPFHQQPCFAGLGYGRGDFPVAEEAAATNLALPIHPHLTEAEASEVANALAAAR